MLALRRTLSSTTATSTTTLRSRITTSGDIVRLASRSLLLPAALSCLRPAPVALPSPARFAASGGYGGGAYLARWQGQDAAVCRPVMVLVRCLFANNVASYGGGVSLAGALHQLTDVTFSGNTAGLRGDAIYSESVGLAPCAYLRDTVMRDQRSSEPTIQAVGPLNWRCPLGAKWLESEPTASGCHHDLVSRPHPTFLARPCTQGV